MSDDQVTVPRDALEYVLEQADEQISFYYEFQAERFRACFDTLLQALDKSSKVVPREIDDVTEREFFLIEGIASQMRKSDTAPDSILWWHQITKAEREIYREKARNHIAQLGWT